MDAWYLASRNTKLAVAGVVTVLLLVVVNKKTRWQASIVWLILVLWMASIVRNLMVAAPYWGGGGPPQRPGSTLEDELAALAVEFGGTYPYVPADDYPLPSSDTDEDPPYGGPSLVLDPQEVEDAAHADSPGFFTAPPPAPAAPPAHPDGSFDEFSVPSSSPFGAAPPG